MLVCDRVCVLLFTNQMQAGFIQICLVGDTNHNYEFISTYIYIVHGYIYNNHIYIYIYVIYRRLVLNFINKLSNWNCACHIPSSLTCHMFSLFGWVAFPAETGEK